MSVILVRKESETPNILNSDDIMGFKYGTNGINGVVKNYQNELGHEINGKDFKIRSGEAIIDGWQVKIDADGATITPNNTTNKEYYSVYLEIDLSVSDDKKASIKAAVDPIQCPLVEKGDDISVSHSGVARMELYRFECTNQVISSVKKVFELLDGTVSKSIFAQYASEDTSKGTIEERLTTLGFKEGSVILDNNTTATINSLKKQGKYVIFNFTGDAYNSNSTITIPEDFRPKESINIVEFNGYNNGAAPNSGSDALARVAKINEDGTIKAHNGGVGITFVNFVNCGWETK